MDTEPKMNLIPCPDCGERISRYAETCPHCVVERKGWAGTIASGVILSWIIPLLVSVVGFVILIMMIGAMASTAVPRR